MSWESFLIASLLAAGSSGTELDFEDLGAFFTAFGECGLDLADLMEQAGQLDSDLIQGLLPMYIDPSDLISIDINQLRCLSEQGLDGEIVGDYAAGMADLSDATLIAALATCGINGDSSSGTITVPDGSGGTATIDLSIFGDLPITTEQIQCLVDNLDQETLEIIAAGGIPPLSALSVLVTCEINLSDLMSAS